jgi:hypothetical protein
MSATYSTSVLPFPANSSEFEEYVSFMESMADEADSMPDPEPPDDSHLDGDWQDYDEPEEDRYLDSMYEDQHEISEYGMDGCCGDF